MKLFFAFISLSIGILSCTTKPTTKYATITINSPKDKNLEVLVTKYEFQLYQEIVELAKAKLDSSGVLTINIEIDHPTFVELAIGDANYSLYLEPGYDIKFSTSENITSKSILFSGIGSEENNYLSQSNQFWNNCFEALGNHIYKSPIEYGNFLDSVSLELSNFNKLFLNNYTLANQSLELFKTKNETKLIFLKAQYKFVNPSKFKNLDSIPGSLLNIFSKLSFERKYLNYGMNNYMNILDFYNRFEIIAPLNLAAADNDSILSLLPISASKKMKEANKNNEIEEILLAKNIEFWLGDKGLTPAIKSIYNQFKTEYSNSEYLNPLEKEYKEYLAISPGYPAPEITGVTINRDTIALSSLRGKIVFIDVWATWCSPCIAEFPYYEAIIKEFKNEEDVVFMFLSTDNEKVKWEEYLRNKLKISGVHIIETNTKEHPTLSESYKLWGIPRYILIDQEGNIVDSKAPRPSSGKVIEEIKALL